MICLTYVFYSRFIMIRLSDILSIWIQDSLLIPIFHVFNLRFELFIFNFDSRSLEKSKQRTGFKNNNTTSKVKLNSE